MRRPASALLACGVLLSAAPAAGAAVSTPRGAGVPASSAAAAPDAPTVIDDRGLGVGYGLTVEPAPCGGPPPVPTGGWDALWVALVVPGQSALVVRAVDEAPDGSEVQVAGLTARVASDADAIEVVVPLGTCPAPSADVAADPAGATGGPAAGGDATSEPTTPDDTTDEPAAGDGAPGADEGRAGQTDAPTTDDATRGIADGTTPGVRADAGTADAAEEDAAAQPAAAQAVAAPADGEGVAALAATGAPRGVLPLGLSLVLLGAAALRPQRRERGARP